MQSIELPEARSTVQWATGKQLQNYMDWHRALTLLVALLLHILLPYYK